MSNKNVRRWSPEGVSQIFADEADVPEGYTDYHPANPPNKPDTNPNKPPALTRAEVIAALEGGAIPYKKNASTPALIEQLTVAVKAHLEKNGTDIPEGADVKQLLALLAPAE